MATAATASLLRGISKIIEQNTIYALPSTRHFIVSSAVLTLSIDGTNFISVDATTTGFESAFAFCSCSGSTATVLVK